MRYLMMNLMQMNLIQRRSCKMSGHQLPCNNQTAQSHHLQLIPKPLPLEAIRGEENEGLAAVNDQAELL
eukprot:7281469-Ditylum_brightwellii.AAC.1